MCSPLTSPKPRCLIQTIIWLIAIRERVQIEWDKKTLKTFSELNAAGRCRAMSRSDMSLNDNDEYYKEFKSSSECRKCRNARVSRVSSSSNDKFFANLLLLMFILTLFLLYYKSE